MDLDVNDERSHVLNISDTMLRFINQEGASGFPTVTVLANRLHIDPDNYRWLSNSDIKDAIKLKTSDNLHWYRSKDLYNGVRQSILDVIFKDAILFKNAELTPIYPKFNKAYSGYYVIDNNNLIYLSQINPAPRVILGEIDATSIIDIVRYDDKYDFILTSHKVYKASPLISNNLSLVYTDNDKNFNAFDIAQDKLIIGSSDGGLVLSGLLNPTLSLEDTIKYKENTVTYSGVDPNLNNFGSNSSSSESDENQTYTRTYTNNLPRNNVINFVKANGSYFSLGNSETAGSFKVDSNYNATPTASTNNSSTPYASVKHFGKDYLYRTSGENSVLMYSSHILPVSSIDDILFDGEVIYIVNQEGINILNSFYDKITTITGSVGYNGTPHAIGIINGTIWLKTSTGYFRSISVTESEFTIRFELFNFVFEKNSSDDKIDVREALLSFQDLVNLCTSNSLYPKIANANNGSTKFIISIIKRFDRNVFILYGNDDRVNLANEIRQCSIAFGIRVDV